jgi:hypothetical protein
MVVQAAQPNTHSHRTQRQAQRHTYQLRRSSLRISRLCAWRGTHPAVSWMQCALAPLGPALSEHDHPCVCAACGNRTPGVSGSASRSSMAKRRMAPNCQGRGGGHTNAMGENPKHRTSQRLHPRPIAAAPSGDHTPNRAPLYPQNSPFC